MERDIKVNCRQKDVDLVKQAIDQAKDVYQKELGHPLNATIDETAFLPEGSAGGVVVNAHEGRIRVSNTLEQRLELLSEQVSGA